MKPGHTVFAVVIVRAFADRRAAPVAGDMARRKAVFKKVQGKGFVGECIAYGFAAALGGHIGVRNP